MARRNLTREARHLMPRTVTTGWDDRARAQVRLTDAIVTAVNSDPVLRIATLDARYAGIRLVFDEMVAKARLHWIGGVPAVTDLTAIERRVASLLGLTADEVAEALKGHPRPATVG